MRIRIVVAAAALLLGTVLPVSTASADEGIGTPAPHPELVFSADLLKAGWKPIPDAVEDHLLLDYVAPAIAAPPVVAGTYEPETVLAAEANLANTPLGNARLHSLRWWNNLGIRGMLVFTFANSDNAADDGYMPLVRVALDTPDHRGAWVAVPAGLKAADLPHLADVVFHLALRQPGATAIAATELGQLYMVTD